MSDSSQDLKSFQTNSRRNPKQSQTKYLAVIAVLLATITILVADRLWRGGSSDVDRLSDTSKVMKTVQPGQTARIVAKNATIIIPKGAIDSEMDITIKELSTTKAPAARKDTRLSGNIFELGPDNAKFNEDIPAVISLSFEAANLTPEELETLHIAFLQDDKWIPVEGNIVDIEAGTVTASVSHFSTYGVFSYLRSAIESAGNAVFQDIFEPKTSFDELPADLQESLKANYGIEAIKGATYWKVSHTTKAATTTIAAANAISYLSGFALSVLDGGQEALKLAVEEALALAIGETAISYATGEDIGTVTIILYESGKLSKTIAEKGFEAIRGSTTLQADIAVWVLSREMDYINAHMNDGLKPLWRLNISTDRLQVYLVDIDGENKITGMHDKGIKYYYYDPGKRKYIDYYANLISRKIEISLADKPGEDSVSDTGTENTGTAEPDSIASAIESSTGSIAAFAENWSWSKERNQDGKYGETGLNISPSKARIAKATLILKAGYSQEAGTASGEVFLSTTQQVKPTPQHSFNNYWYGNTLTPGFKAGVFTCSYAASEHSFDVTEYVRSSSSSSKYYVAVGNKATADVGISGVKLIVEIE